MAKIVVVYYSSTGKTHQLADALAEGARAAGAEVRLRRVAELASQEAIDSNPLWRAHVDTVAAAVPEATPADLEWADSYAVGTPTRFGTPAAQLKQFIDTLGGLWFEGKLANKGATTFTTAQHLHGGNETTILTLFNVFSHFGAVIVPPGYTDPAVFEAGGNPYGVSSASAAGEAKAVTAAELTAAGHQGRRLAEVTAKLVA
ncbi:NAD(P)H:quinone oxidoreductase [Streptomyces fuscichromogenes]|uniref:NAD(P)H dehydrogenase (Quinone) n=1 Tax=Streptomyces fuscichromogenes TaxID=1324013 RepID=A0A917XGC3_9ACTN|nr:NAD(P)H:quinone oxidoreductase [Streptomyces fuscichromogenes]GGN20325.1 NAD(P)H dehydrogenase (quinone) [Streptomyces fuscichromogenes]